MEPKIQTFLTASKHFLQQGNFQECRKYAIKANDVDPKNTAISQILAIAEVLLLSNTINEQPNYYSILKVPFYTQDQLLIKKNFMNVTNLLNPNQNLYPFASEAFQVVLKAWSVLSNPTRKTLFDNELKNMEKDGRAFDPIRMTHFDDGLKTGGFSVPTRMTRFDDGFKSVRFLDPTQKTCFDDGGNFYDPTRKTPFDDGLKTSEKGGSFVDPSRKTRFDDGLKTNEKGGSFLDPTKNTRFYDGDGGNMFWTMCPYCYYVYEYFKDYEDCCLRCQNDNCKRVLHALPIVGPPPPPEVAGKGEYYCFGFSVLGTEGKSVWSPFVAKKKDEDEFDMDDIIEISDDDQEEDGNGGKKESLEVKKKLVKTNGGEVDKGYTSVKKKRIKLMAKSSNKVLGKGNKVNMKEIACKGNNDFEFANKNDVEFFYRGG
ncbi:unnamed protein product [Withania somnifera]